MRQFLSLILFITALSFGGNKQLFAQDVKFTYDETGNRIQRNVIVLRSGTTSKLNASGKEKDIYDANLGEQKVVIYPNPTQGQILVDIQGNLKDLSTTLSLFDLNGRLLICKPQVSSTICLDLSIYHSGVYILKITSGDKTSEWKIIKE